MHVAKAETVWLDVEFAADDAEWSAHIQKLKTPSTTKLSFTEKGSGEGATSLYRLAKGTYTFTIKYSGNSDEYGADNFVVWLNSENGFGDLLVNDISKGRTVTKKVNIRQAGIYWLDIDHASPNAEWTIKAGAPAKKFSSAPTPTISGTAKAGNTLTARAGSWNPKPSLKYQWYRSGAKISGATTSTYKPTTADCGKSLKVEVTGKKSGYTTKTVASKATKKVTCSTFSNAPKPTISGTAKVGSTLTAKAGTWKPKATLTYQWMRDGKKISGATTSTYTLAPADLNAAITVAVKATRSGYTSATATSKSTASVAPGVMALVTAPKVAGDAIVGQELTVSRGEWAPQAEDVSYQWFRGDDPIAGATTVTYAVSQGDVGRPITVEVTPKRTGYAAEPWVSEPIVVVGDAVDDAN